MNHPPKTIVSNLALKAFHDEREQWFLGGPFDYKTKAEDRVYQVGRQFGERREVYRESPDRDTAAIDLELMSTRAGIQAAVDCMITEKKIKPCRTS